MALEEKVAHLWHNFNMSIESINALPSEGMSTLEGVLRASSFDLGGE